MSRILSAVANVKGGADVYGVAILKKKYSVFILYTATNKC